MRVALARDERDPRSPLPHFANVGLDPRAPGPRPGRRRAAGAVLRAHRTATRGAAHVPHTHARAGPPARPDTPLLRRRNARARDAQRAPAASQLADRATHEPERLTNEIAGFLDELWSARGAGRNGRTPADRVERPARAKAPARAKQPARAAKRPAAAGARGKAAPAQRGLATVSRSPALLRGGSGSLACRVGAGAGAARAASSAAR